MRTYLYAIALKLLATERKKQYRNNLVDELTTEPSVPGTQESGLWVREALAKLNAEVLMLREYEQLSYPDIAELLRLLPVNTVRSRLFRSRTALKQHLDPKHSLRSHDMGSESGTSVRSAEDEA